MYTTLVDIAYLLFEDNHIGGDRLAVWKIANNIFHSTINNIDSIMKSKPSFSDNESLFEISEVDGTNHKAVPDRCRFIGRLVVKRPSVRNLK